MKKQTNRERSRSREHGGIRHQKDHKKTEKSLPQNTY